VEYTYDDLRHKTVAELREIAATLEHEAVRGHTTMHKDHLLPALCQALGVETHVHHEVVGLNKSQIKARIRGLKAERDAALKARDHQSVKTIRRRIHNLKRTIHKATV